MLGLKLNHVSKKGHLWIESLHWKWLLYIAKAMELSLPCPKALILCSVSFLQGLSQWSSLQALPQRLLFQNGPLHSFHFVLWPVHSNLSPSCHSSLLASPGVTHLLAWVAAWSDTAVCDSIKWPQGGTVAFGPVMAPVLVAMPVVVPVKLQHVQAVVNRVY